MSSPSERPADAPPGRPAAGLEPNVFLGSLCNQRCLFCAEGTEDKTQDDAEIARVIASRPRTLSIEGGEPTLSRRLERCVLAARRAGIPEIVVCTNAAPFVNERLARRLRAAGVTLFNVNFPSHVERLFDLLTQTRGQFKRRVRAVRTLIRAAGGDRVRLNLVVNRLNVTTAPQYARFVANNFPEASYVEFNLVKRLGWAAGRSGLVPRLREARPYLARALRFLAGRGMRFIIDGFPLCQLEGHEDRAIDAYKLAFGESLYLGEKRKTARCAGCSLGGLCAGPRADYLELYGDAELEPSRRDPAPIEERLRAMRARAAA